MRHTKLKSKRAVMPAQSTYPATKTIASSALLPLGAMLMASSMAAMAQTTPATSPATTTDASKTLKPVVVKEKAEAAEGKDAVRATETTIGKGKQLLRDIPQSITVVTEKLMDDRNLDTVKEALKNTAGISFQAAEGGEEDIKLRGFSLAASGDIFVDGMRDPAFYERDTFNLDRLEVLRGSASMLFGRGSTGGAVNQVNKVPRLLNENQVDLTLGTYNHRRIVGDFNLQTGDAAALRINTMSTSADNNGSGSSLSKKGVAATYRWGIGERDEFSVGLNYLDNRNGMNYGMPWIRTSATAPVASTTTVPLDPSAYYGMGSDYNYGSATYGTFAHLRRFDDGSELKTQVRKGNYTRDQRASIIRFQNATNLSTFNENTVLTRSSVLKIQDLDTLFVQSDYSSKFQALGLKHEVLAGLDLAKEHKIVYAARTAAQGGVTIAFPTTTVGSPNYAQANEASRVLRPNNEYESIGGGVYVQDLIQIAPSWKLLAGLRFDSLVGNYDTFGLNAANQPIVSNSYQMKVGAWSKRAGVLYQPNDLHSYHFSVATSFNTSGDTYSLSAANVNIPPEESLNIELGAKLDSADKRFTTRLALFQSTKLNERNTDPLSNLVTLSGKRHVTGVELDFSGHLTPQWEIYGSYIWMPDAMIDIGAAGAEGQGTRPSLTPYYTGTVWSTYQVTPQWRLGAGLNIRGSQTPLRNPGFEVPAFATADLMAEYKVNDKFIVKANLSNITNVLYADQLYTAFYVPGAGRTFQVTGTMKF